MNRPILLLCTCLLAGSLSVAQKGDTLRKYLDDRLFFASKNKSTYPGIAIRKGDSWLLVALYPDTGMLVKAYFKDNEMKVKNGPFILYHPKNVVAMEGHYVDDVQQGPWKFWYTNGQLKDSGIMKNNFLSGTWKSWYDNGTLAIIATYPDDDSITQIIRSSSVNVKNFLFKGDTTVIIKHGPWQSFYTNGAKKDSGSYTYNAKTGTWKSWYETGQLESSGSFVNNMQEGTWNYYRRKGAPSTQEIYKDGKIVSMACYDEEGHFTDSFCSILKPPVPLLDRFVDFDNYVLDHISWPENILMNTRVEGIVKVQFIITKEGKLSNFKILSSPHDLLSREVENFFSSLPDWSPAISHNRIVDFTMEYEIPFKRPQE